MGCYGCGEKSDRNRTIVHGFWPERKKRKEKRGWGRGEAHVYTGGACSLVVLLPVLDGPDVGEQEEGAGKDRVDGRSHHGSDESLQEYHWRVWGSK